MMQPQLSSLMIYPRKKETKTTPPKTVPSHLTKKKKEKEKKTACPKHCKASHERARWFVCLFFNRKLTRLKHTAHTLFHFQFQLSSPMYARSSHTHIVSTT